MKTNLKLSSAVLLMAMAISCSKKVEGEDGSSKIVNAKSFEESADTASVDAVNAESKSAEMSSSAAKVDPKSNRKFIRTAEAKFKVKNVFKSTNTIEDLAVKFGGFVTLSELNSQVTEKDETQGDPGGKAGLRSQCGWPL